MLLFLPLPSAVHPLIATSSSFLPSHPLTFTSISCRSLNCHTHSAVISNCHIHQLLMPSAQIQLSHPSAFIPSNVSYFSYELRYHIFCQRPHASVFISIGYHIHQASQLSAVISISCHFYQVSHSSAVTFMSCHIHITCPSLSWAISQLLS